MRAETGDQQLRFHHLRHSFATWTTLRLFLSDLESIPEFFSDQPKTQEWLNQSKQFRSQLYLSTDITRKHIYAVASLLGHAGPEMTLEHYVHCMDLVTYISRQERVDVSVLNKAINFATGKLYQYKAHKNGAKLIALARDAAAKTTKKKNARSMVLDSDDGDSSRNASGDDNGDTAFELGATVLENLNTFLSVYSQQQSKDLASLCARFGYNESAAKRYVQNAEILASNASLRSEKPRLKTQVIERNGEKFSSLAPYWRLGGADHAEFCDMADRAYVLVTSDEIDVESVCKYYINNKWGSQNGLIFHSLRQQDDARSYVDFLLGLGVDEKRIQLSFFKGINVKARRRWQSIFNLKRGNVLRGVSPYNKSSKSLSGAVRVKVLTQPESNLHANTEIPVIQLLMYLLAVLILDDSGAV